MEIDTLEGVQLGGITQWIRVRGAHASNPVLLLMQQGPGLPIINEARRLEHLLGLQNAFTVVYWDQRGTGLSSPSLREDPNRFEISVARMVDDTVTLLELLRGDSVARHSSPGSPSARPSRCTPLRGARSSWPHWWRLAWTSTCLRPRTTPTPSRSTPPAGAATGAQSGSWKRSGRPRTQPRSSSLPGPLGGQFWRRSDQRELQQRAPRAARQLGPLAGLLGRRRHPCRSWDPRVAGRAAAPACHNRSGSYHAAPRRPPCHSARPS
jgi:hypothetical protein